MRFRIFWLIFSLASFGATAALADDLDSALSDPAADSTDDVVPETATESEAIPDDAQTLRLSLDESIQLALQNNLDVEVQRFTPLIEGERETEAWGAYDPEFFAEFGYSDTENPSSFTLEGQELTIGDSYDGFGGFRGLLPYLGSEYSFQFNGERTTLNNVFQTLSPEYRSSFSLSVTQPLLRGLIWRTSGAG